jgi:hypothetical protein
MRNYTVYQPLKRAAMDSHIIFSTPVTPLHKKLNMSTEPTSKKLPPRIHKAPKRFGDEQDNPGPAKKNKSMARSAEKSARTTLEKPTENDAQSILKFQKPKPKPTTASKVAPPVAPTQKRTSVEVEEVDSDDPADRQRSEPPRDQTQILERTDGSDDESNSDQEDNVIEILEEPVESAEMELSSY